MGRHQGRPTGHGFPESPDCRDQLRDGDLAGHRIRHDRRIHRPPVPACQHTGGHHDLRDSFVDAVRVAALPQALAPIHQSRGVKRGLIQPVPARSLPPQIKGQSLGGRPVRQPLQRL